MATEPAAAAPKPYPLWKIFLWALLLSTTLAVVDYGAVWTMATTWPWQDFAANLAGRVLGVPVIALAAVSLSRFVKVAARTLTRRPS